jgi:hypothetical protein
MNVTINIIELASELADKDLETHFGENRWTTPTDTEEDEDVLIYTEEAQDLFNEYYDYYFDIIEQTKI